MLPVMWACIMFFMPLRCNALRKMRYFAHVFFIGAKEITTMQQKHHRSLTVSFIVAIAFFMQFLDTTAVNTAIPTMAASFGTDVIHISTGITSYVIALAVFIPVSGWVADRFGTRRVFSSAVAFFIIASALCGMSQNLGQFVACRILQGMAGAMMSPVGRLAVLKVTPKEDLPAAMNYITLPALVAPVVGPLVGGYLATYMSWHWIFYLNIPVGIACVILALRYIPREASSDGNNGKPFDFPGFVLSGVGLAGFMYGVEMFSREGMPYYVPFVVIGVSAGLLALSVLRSSRTKAPLIDYSVMKVFTYRVTITTGSISRMIIGVFPYLGPLMFQVGFGLSPFESGLLFLSTMAGNLCMKSVTVWVIKRFQFRSILLVNGALSALFTLFTALLVPSTPVWLMVSVLFVSGMFRSMQFSTLTTLAFSDIPEREMTSANTLYSTIQQMSIGMGIAVVAVSLRFSNIINGGQAGHYTVADFRMAFIFVAVVGLAHLYGYVRLAKDAGSSVKG